MVELRSCSYKSLLCSGATSWVDLGVTLSFSLPSVRQGLWCCWTTVLLPWRDPCLDAPQKDIWLSFHICKGAGSSRAAREVRGHLISPFFPRRQEVPFISQGYPCRKGTPSGCQSCPVAPASHHSTPACHSLVHEFEPHSLFLLAFPGSEMCSITELWANRQDQLFISPCPP